MPRFITVEQGTPEWHAARAGYATASRFKDIMSAKDSRERYLYELVGERLANAAKREHSSKTMEWGHVNEPLAREEYRIQTGNLVTLTGFAVHSRILWLGASSDGLVDDDGATEIKSPFNSGIHARTLAKGMPDDHLWQTQGNLLVLERKWIDFCSWDPHFDSPYNLYIQRIERDKKLIDHMTVELKKFLADVAIAVQDIKSKYH
jgi:putative phage-type endonuclease